jgi:probable rRNA maturation factor
MAAEPAPDPAGSLRIHLTADIDIDQAVWASAGAGLDALCRKMARSAFERVQDDLDFGDPSISEAELSLRLTSDREVQQLNHQFRGIDKPTNVLSFAALDHTGPALPDGAPVFLGDIAIAAETVAREASEQDKPVTEHLAHLVIHGTLHLLGYDHEAEEEALEMEALERDVLKQHGIDDPYQAQDLIQ